MSDIEGEFEDHGRFARVADSKEATDGRAGSDATRERAEEPDESGGAEFEPTTNDWDARATVDDETVELEVTVPALSAVVNESVADVVEDGWYDTFERRVVDADSVTLADDVTVTGVSREDGDVVVELTMTPRTGKAADDALALVNYVEGTWFEGVIPGYDYVEEVQSMRERAAQNGQGSSI